MASSKATSYRLCCHEGTRNWIQGTLRYAPIVKGWVYPSPQLNFPLFKWQFCPFCGEDLPPFEPTRPYDPTSDGE